MATMMKAAVVREFGKPLVFEEVPVPTPGPGEVLIKVAATGVCHTDLHAADGTSLCWRSPKRSPSSSSKRPHPLIGLNGRACLKESASFFAIGQLGVIVQSW